MIRLKAIVVWGSEASGCLEHPFSGIRPSFLIRGDLIASIIISENGMNWMPRNEECSVIVELPYGEHYLEFLITGLEFKLHVGAREIAFGRIVEVLPDSQEGVERDRG